VAAAEEAARAAAAEQAAAAARLVEAERAWAASEAAREAAELDALTNGLAQLAQAPAESAGRSALASTVSGLLGLLTGKTTTSDPAAITHAHDPRLEAVLHSPQPKNIPPTSALAQLQSMLGIFQHAESPRPAPTASPADAAALRADADAAAARAKAEVAEDADAWVNNLLGRSPHADAGALAPADDDASTEVSALQTADAFASGTLYADLGTAVARHLQSFENGLAAGGSPPPGAARNVAQGGVGGVEVGPSRSPTLTLPGSIFPDDAQEASFAVPSTREEPTVPLVAAGAVVLSPSLASPAARVKSTPPAARAKTQLFVANSPFAQPVARGRRAAAGSGAKAGKGSFAMAPRTGILLDAKTPLTVGARAAAGGGARRSVSPRAADAAAVEPSPSAELRSQSTPRAGLTPKPAAPSPYVVAKPSPASRAARQGAKAAPRNDDDAAFTVPPAPTGASGDAGAAPSAPSVTPWTREGDALFGFLDQFGLGSIAEPSKPAAGFALKPVGSARSGSGLRVGPPPGAAPKPDNR
jgi:hypothetical protein